ncbi:MAG: type II secretion system protein N [Rubrivivax sp.]
MRRLFARRAPGAPPTVQPRGWEASRFDAAAPSTQRRWPWWGGGLVLGTLLALLVHAPASWLAAAVARATDQRVLLADAGGSVWSGHAVLVLIGGSGSRDASALPGRLRWTLGLARENRLKLELRLRHACCIDDQLRLRLEPGFGRWRVSLPAGRMAVGHWPAAWLSGLGTPFNSLQLGGWMNLSSDGLSVESVQGRWRVSGHAELDLNGVSSRLSPLDTLGSYRIVLGAGGAGAAEGAELRLATLQGPLRLSGNGQWVGGRLRFRGEARADAGSEAMLNNLLNIIGRRQGALAVLAIG